MTIERIFVDTDHCPECGGEFYTRERCPQGVSWCKQGHAWRSNYHLTKKLMPDGRMHTVKVEQYVERIPRRDVENG